MGTLPFDEHHGQERNNEAISVSRPSWPRRVEGVPPSNRGQDARDTGDGFASLARTFVTPDRSTWQRDDLRAPGATRSST